MAIGSGVTVPCTDVINFRPCALQYCPGLSHKVSCEKRPHMRPPQLLMVYYSVGLSFSRGGAQTASLHSVAASMHDVKQLKKFAARQT